MDRTKVYCKECNQQAVKHTLKNGTEIDITGYFYMDAVMARTNLSGKWYDGELKSPAEQSDRERDAITNKGCKGYWSFSQVLLPPEKGEEVKQMAIAVRDAKLAEEKAIFDASVANCEAFRTVEYSPAYGCELRWARQSTPEDKLADWVVVGYAGSPRVKVEYEALKKVINGRKSCGSFPGCNNTVWQISAEEWDTIIALSTEIREQKEGAKKAFEKAEADDIQHKIDTGYCFYCESWCSGDCGHYSNNPNVKFNRDFRQAQREANYGINDNA